MTQYFFQVPLRKGTFLEGSHLSVRKTLILLYCFAGKYDYKLAMAESTLSEECEDTETGTSSKTIADIYYNCREMCINYVKSNMESCKIGGFGKTVQIDESKFGKRKYNRGRITDGNWVLGGICDETGDMFLKILQKRDKDTLIPIILNHVAKGSIIVTDCWKAYNGLKEEYEHLKVNHSLNVVGK